MTVQDADAPNEVVSGIITISNIFAYILFILGSICFIVSKDFAKQLNLSRDLLENTLNTELR